MKEKTKQILRYVACGLGGLALGIGLLGGLSMCATSANKQTEEVNTILATRKNAVTTDQNSNITSYTFDIQEEWSETNAIMNWRVYDVNPSTYELTSVASGTRTAGSDQSDTKSIIQTIYNDYIYSGNNALRFLAVWQKADWWGNGYLSRMAYFSFILPNGYSITYSPKAFTKIGWDDALGVRFDRNYLGWGDDPATTYFVTYEQSNIILVDMTNQETDPVSSLRFQDVESYYKTQGYTDGHTAGYSEGYDDAYAEKDSGIAFTSCGVYPNAHVTLATDETIGNFKYMYLCHYITKPGYDEHTIYIMWTTNANTGQYLGEVIDRNDSDSYDPAVTLGSFTQQATSSVTITATQDMEFGLWVGYITTFHNRGEITNSILWFQGGTAESDMQIYQNGYDEGYQNGNQQGQQTGYENGYTEGKQAGDAEGYERGYTDGFEQTNTKNVFSLFTSAFDSVASFFDLKIFGFLPLYWFFLAPLFIALISLLMRMVKH